MLTAYWLDEKMSNWISIYEGEKREEEISG